MKSEAITADTEAEVWLRILHPERELTPQISRAIINLSIPASDIARMRQLSAKAQGGTLTPSENQEMDNFERVGAILSTLKSRARLVLKRSRRRL